MIGSPEKASHRFSSEKPEHQVEVESFLLGRYPITFRQWEFIAKLPSIDTDLKVRPARKWKADWPVFNISWCDAIEFCKRLSKLTGSQYRLPSETEWEYACRAGSDTPFHFGKTIVPSVAIYDGRYPYLSNQKIGSAQESCVGVNLLKYSNTFGLYGMHGNVWEWCLDHWHDSYIEAPSDGTPWLNMHHGSENRRVIRGGSWFNEASECRSRQRGKEEETATRGFVGFRVAKSLSNQ